MQSQSRRFKPVFPILVIATLGVSLVVGIAETGLAEYQAPPSTSPSRRRIYTSNAPRWYLPRPDSRNGSINGLCEGMPGPRPMLLAPQQFMGQTVASQPTLTWFLPAGGEGSVARDLPIELTLYAFNAAEGFENATVKHHVELPYQSGFQRYQLPDTVSLAAGQTYLWEWIVDCDLRRSSDVILQLTTFQVVTSQPALAEEFSETASTIEQATALAAAGFWYDAIALIIPDSTPAAQQLRTTLLEDLALTEEAIAAETIDTSEAPPASPTTQEIPIREFLRQMPTPAP